MELTAAVQLPFLLLVLPFFCAPSILIGPFVRPKGWTYRRYVSYTFLRIVARLGILSKLRSPSVTTVKVYRDHMRRQNLEPIVVNLGAGATAGWIGPATSEKVLLYFHGGAYSSPAAPGHMTLLQDLLTTANKNRNNLRVLVVCYGLTPKAQYPLQLIQAAHALKYLIENVRYRPEDIFMAGDSAGGHLAISLLSHLSHPHSEVLEINLDGGKLGGTFLISPWVSFDYDSPSMRVNAKKDYVGPATLTDPSRAFFSNAKDDPYNRPLSAHPDWWQDLSVRHLCVLVGEYEVFLDDVHTFAQLVKKTNPKLELYVAPAEIHVQAIVDREMGFGMASSEHYFRQWVLKQLDREI